MRPGSLRSVPIAAPSVQGKPCKARNGRWTGRPHRESPRASVSASPVIIYYNACLKTQSDRLLVTDGGTALACCASGMKISHEVVNQSAGERVRGDLHIQTVNSLHERIKTFLRARRGVATKYRAG